MSTRYCRQCDYPLDGVAEHRCPECGRGFDPDRPRTFAISPGAKRRMWFRRAGWIAAVLAVAWLVAPRRVVRLVTAVPSVDGLSVTTRTGWFVVGPSWFPVRYPRWWLAESVGPVGPGTFQPLAVETWKLVGVRYVRRGGWSIGAPAQAGFVGCVVVQSIGSDGLAASSTIVPVVSERMQEIVEVVVYDDPENPSRRLVFSLMARSKVPQASKGGT